MKHFPIFLAVEGQRIVVSGGGEAAIAKLRLLLKTEALLIVIGESFAPEIEAWAQDGRVMLIRRRQAEGDATGAALFYAANDDEHEDARATRLAQADGALTNWVDNLEASQFITPAIVDRDPVTVAIGTEGAAPVLARSIKADLEERLPRSLGVLARVGKRFRRAAEALPFGAKRRAFWRDYYMSAGPKAFDAGGEVALEPALSRLLERHLHKDGTPGHVTFVGAGPGDPELLTLKARRTLHEADVVIHDRLVTPEILELARREATIINMGKTGFGPSTPQSEIDAAIVAHARDGANVVRLKSGDATLFGRLDEEIEACLSAGVAFSVVPGITSASAAVATIGQSLTRRGRNSSVRFLTGQDVAGYADHDWRALSKPGEVAAIYMGKRAARYLQGRLTMYGADPATPLTLVENASRSDQRVFATNLAKLATDLDATEIQGPCLILLGLAPRDAAETGLIDNKEIAL